MLHLLYILAFTFLAFIAINNLLGNLVRLSRESQRPYAPQPRVPQTAPHPELLDDAGRVTSEPLLVMRSVNVEDARAQLDALYDSAAAERGERGDDA